ncbi:hypothetical protein ASJ81_15895 [Methanosarcina spelaei]|uniref:Uncharacterized protein n=1 Tax=Methanosarcina spelaei TaxID=1036679 RepID=A0A2A2HXF3_9EURY|nr:hypothetical protein ASJ81_15895 [Methanosarcina spelaei]
MLFASFLFLCRDSRQAGGGAYTILLIGIWFPESRELSLIQINSLSCSKKESSLADKTDKKEEELANNSSIKRMN